MDQSLDVRLEAGRAAFDRHEWVEAYECLSAAGRESPLAWQE